MKRSLSLAVAQFALPLVLVGPALAADVESTVLQFGNVRGVGTTPAGGVAAAFRSSSSVIVYGFLQMGGDGFGGVFDVNIVEAGSPVNFLALTTTPVSGEEPDVVSIGQPIFDGPNFFSLGYITLSTGGTYHNGDILQLYTYAGNTDGNKPKGPALSLGGSEGVVSSATYGGTGFGTLLNITPNNGNKIVHTFSGTDGSYPSGLLAIDNNNSIYGTTTSGGTHGYGTVYKSGTTFTVLYNFAGGADGATPVGGLIIDSSGNLYGTTEYGGTGTGQGNGTVFKIAADGTKTTLYNMDSHTGTHPTGNLVLSPAGDLYGTTSVLGVKPVPGEVFKVTADGVGSAVHRFATTDGYGPLPRINSASVNDVFTVIGATASGGTNNAGVIFKVAVTK